MLPQEAIQEFKELYRQRFKKELDDKDAIRKAENLLELYRAILEPSATDFPYPINIKNETGSDK